MGWATGAVRKPRIWARSVATGAASIADIAACAPALSEPQNTAPFRSIAPHGNGISDPSPQCR